MCATFQCGFNGCEVLITLPAASTATQVVLDGAQEMSLIGFLASTRCLVQLEATVGWADANTRPASSAPAHKDGEAHEKAAPRPSPPPGPPLIPPSITFPESFQPAVPTAGLLELKTF